MNRQEVINKVVPAMIAQGRKSGSGSACLYRDASGANCAVGVLLDPDLIDGLQHIASRGYMISAAADEEIVLDALRESGYEIEDEDEDFLVRLQGAHDGASDKNFVEDFKSNMRTLCNDYGLEMPDVA